MLGLTERKRLEKNRSHDAEKSGVGADPQRWRQEVWPSKIEGTQAMKGFVAAGDG